MPDTADDVFNGFLAGRAAELPEEAPGFRIPLLRSAYRPVDQAGGLCPLICHRFLGQSYRIVKGPGRFRKQGYGLIKEVLERDRILFPPVSRVVRSRPERVRQGQPFLPRPEGIGKEAAACNEQFSPGDDLIFAGTDNKAPSRGGKIPGCLRFP